MNETVILDFNLTSEQLESLSLHILFKQKEAYNDVKFIVDDDDRIDKVQVWFDVSYNDNTYDVTPIYFDLIQGDKIIMKRKGYVYDDIEISEYDGSEGHLQSFIVTRQMILN